MSFVKFFLLLIIVLIITIGAFYLSEVQYINSSLGGTIGQVGLVLTLFLIIKGFISLFSKKKDKAKIYKKKTITKEKKTTSSYSKLIWWISGAVGLVILLMFIGSGGNNSGTGYKSDYLVDYRNTVRNGQPYVMCTYQSGKKMYVKYFMNGSNQQWKNWGCKDDLNN